MLPLTPYRRNQDGQWPEKPFAAVGSLRALHRPFHGFPARVPLMALPRHSSVSESTSRMVRWGL